MGSWRGLGVTAVDDCGAARMLPTPLPLDTVPGGPRQLSLSGSAHRLTNICLRRRASAGTN